MNLTDHHCSHQSLWLCVIPGQRKNKCLMCFFNILGDITLSVVQHQVTLSWIKSLLEEESQQTAVATLISDIELSKHLLDLLTDCYTSRLIGDLSAEVCVALNEKAQHEDVYKHIMHKCYNLICVKADEESIYFSLIVMTKMCEEDSVYAKVLLRDNVEMLLHMMEISSNFPEVTLKKLMKFLTLLMDALIDMVSDRETEKLMLRIMEREVEWLNATHQSSTDLSSLCLKLILSTMGTTDIVKGLLSICPVVPTSASLLIMGLKKTLATKDQNQVFAAMQCLERLFSLIREPLEITFILETDLAEFVFESLLSKNADLLMLTFHCLELMAVHNVFFEKCHASYGISSCLTALNIAIEMDAVGIVKRGLSFLTTLLERQPDDMPLLTNATWNRCIQILMEVLSDKWIAVLPEVLNGITALLRQEHQQNPVDFASLKNILTSVLTQFQHKTEADRHSEKSEEVQFLVSIIMDIFLRAHRLISFAAKLPGNEESVWGDFQMFLEDFTSKIIFPTFQDTCENLPCATVEKLLGCLEICVNLHINLDVLVISGLLSHLLNKVPHLPENVRLFAGHVVFSILQHFLPNEINGVKLFIIGLARTKWLLNDPEEMLIGLSAREEFTSALIILYLFNKFGCSPWSSIHVTNFLCKAMSLYPDFLSQSEEAVIKAFLYLFSLVNAAAEDSDPLATALDTFLQDELVQLPVAKWYMPQPVVFQWIFNTTDRAAQLGSLLIEYWILQSQNGEEHTCATGISSLSSRSDPLNILGALYCSPHFLLCLMHLVRSSQFCKEKAREVLIYCISKIINGGPENQTVAILQLLINKVTEETEDGLWNKSNQEGNAFLLPIICALLSSPFKDQLKWNFSVKTVLHVSRLMVQREDAYEYEVVRNCLIYLSSMTEIWSPQESKMLIPALMQDKGFANVIEESRNSSDPTVVKASLALSVWLAENSYQCQAKFPVTISVNYLLTSLITNCTVNSKYVLKLLTIVLSNSPELMCRGVEFEKSFTHFSLSAELFTAEELRQIFIYLQQYLIQDNVILCQAAELCFEKLLDYCNKKNVNVLASPWAVAMLEAKVSNSRKALCSLDVNICSLIKEKVNQQDPNLLKALEKMTTEKPEANISSLEVQED